MKKVLLLFTLASVIFTACKKDGSTTNVTNVYSNDARPSYIVTGLHDVSITQGQNAYISLPITVEYQDSAQENVTISVSGLPTGMLIDSTATFSGIPTFTCNLAIYDTTVVTTIAAGTYPVTVTTTGSRTGVRTLIFTLKVQTPPNKALLAAGTYNNCFNSCSGTTYQSVVTADANQTNKIYISNLLGFGQTLYATINASTNSILIPSQTVGDYTFSGSGTLGQTGTNTYELYLQQVAYIYNGTSNSCYTYIQH